MADQDERDYDEISQRAYQRFQERGRVHGNDQDDWFQAEREIRNRQQPQREPAGRAAGERGAGVDGVPPTSE